MTDRKAYQRVYARSRRQALRPTGPRTVIAKASRGKGQGGVSICLTKAGLVSGLCYLAEPKPNGAILLTPQKETNE